MSGTFFSFFGARPQLGRLFVADDDRPGAEPVAVVSHAFWLGVLGGDPGVVGKPLRINAQTFTPGRRHPPGVQELRPHRAALYPVGAQ